MNKIVPDQIAAEQSDQELFSMVYVKSTDLFLSPISSSEIVHFRSSVIEELTLCMLGNFSYFCRLLTFFKT